jgi:hypothetical protein
MCEEVDREMADVRANPTLMSISRDCPAAK